MKVDGDGVIDLLDSSGESSSSDGAPVAAPRAVQRQVVTARKAAPRALPAPTGKPMWAASSSGLDDESKSQGDSSSEDLQAVNRAAHARQKQQLQKQTQNVRSSHGVRVQIGRRRKRPHSSEEESEEESEEVSEEESAEESENESEDDPRIRKRRSPAKKKLRVVERPAPSKQPRATKVPASHSRNDTRVSNADIRQLAEGMSFSELQAQEQAMARFQAQNARRASRPAAAKSTPPPKARHAQRSPAPRAAEQNAGHDTNETWKISEGVSNTELQAQQQAMKRLSSQKTRRPALKPRDVDESEEDVYEHGDDENISMVVQRRAKPIRVERSRKRSTKLKKVDASDKSEESAGSWEEEEEEEKGEGVAQENQAPPRNRASFSRKPRVALRTAGAVKQHMVAKTPLLSNVRGVSKASSAIQELVESKDISQFQAQEQVVRRIQAEKSRKATSRPAVKRPESSSSEVEDEKSEDDEPVKPRKVVTQVSAKRHQKRSAEKHVPMEQAARPSPSTEDLVDATFHGMQLISETMSLSELQAQERALRSFQKQKKRQQAGAAFMACNGQHPGHIRKSNGGAGRRAHMGAQIKLADPPSTTTYVSTPSRNGFSAPMVDLTPSASRTLSIGGTSAAPPNPVVHSTAWRRLCFLEAPSNILHGVAISPYASGGDKPLWDYDPTGSLKQKCKIVLTASNVGLQDAAQAEVDAQVREMVEKELPEIRECHARRVREILKGTRTELVEYFQANREIRNETFRRLQWSELANLQTSLQVSPVERAAAQRLQQEPAPLEPLNALVGTVRYFVRQGDSQFERLVYPETVAHLSNDITSLRRSFTMIGVRKNPFVEGDPVLRYVPYLGDNAQLGIDRHRYTGTTMDKQRRITELGGDCGEDCGGKCEELKAIKPSARDDEIQECLLRVVVTKCGGSKQVFRALKHEAAFDRPLTDYNEMKNVYMAERRTAKRVAEVQRLIARSRESPPANDGAAASQAHLSSVLQKLARPSWFLRDPSEPRSLTERLLPPMSSFESNYAECPQAEGIRNRTSYDGVIEWHRDLFCRRCFTYDCNEHGIQNPRCSRREDPINPVVSVPGIVLQSRELGTQGGEFSIEEDQEKKHNEDIPADAAQVVDLLESGSSSDNEPLSNLSKLSGKAHEPSETPGCRRSRRSQTRISSMASANLVEQEKMQERERLVEEEKKKEMRQKFTRAAYNSEYLDDTYLPVVKDTMKTVLSKTTACSSTCWKAVSACDTPSGQELSLLNAVLVRKLASIFANNACVVSTMLKRSGCTCAQIKAFLENETKRRDNGAGVELEEGMVAPEDRREKQGRRQSGATVGGKRSMAKRGRKQRSYGVEKTLSFKPCNHEGVCDGCDCVQRGHTCNKTCSCPRDCPNRFQGCHCSMGSCGTSSCPCWSADRECDPDYCFSCGATDAAVMVFHPTFKAQSSYNVGICCNVNLLRGHTQKKVGIAFSATHGWGAFALEPIRKGEFVMEYTGSLILDDEAERRGAVYDRLSVSYLFNVNNDEVVDAARQGNKAKFANHRLTGEANMNVKILEVNGEHRIGLFASESIELGAELFFDYGYTHDTAPQWSQLRQNGAPRPVWTIDDDDDCEWDWE